ncbi:response regulator [Paenibacillus sp. sptzw28]|uniref:response regulator n=1 Tax=Paenibacillus sp. sptzw28 TaxID=715179 RepID=UPI001C6E105D|nr:response regulator [Paenibacillus sp. sptzw28]QYR19469.1 response regulator [Paenibacillus sp. sptzw28]
MRTIKVLLADDEPVILRGLKKLIPWEELGLEIVGEAYDGVELRQLLEKCSPDLIISDICMPGCSGIDVIKDINASRRPVKVVFISAYQEFSYAQDAVKYGAVDYLVKPVDKLQLEQVILKTVALIREESEEERNKEMLVHFESKKRTETIGELLDRLTDGNRSAAESLTQLGIVTGQRLVTVCLAELDGISGNAQRWQERERKLIDFAVSNIIAEAVVKAGSGLMFRKGDLFGILIQHDDEEEPTKLAEDLHNKINTFLKLEISIGIGRPVNHISEAHETYRDASDILKTKYFLGLNRVIPHQWMAPDPEARLRLARLQTELARRLTQAPAEDYHETVRELLTAIKTLSCGCKNSAVASVYSTVIMLEQELKSVGIPMESADSEGHPLLEKLSAYRSFGELEEGMEKLVNDIRAHIAEKTGNKELMQLVQVKNYIEEHYAENITLESISALAYMNPYYFSSFFKKHNGENFKAYVTEVRMKHALRLLMQTDLMVYEIAEKVGYNNARHFSDMFKKRYGKLPQEYKQAAKD